MGVTTFCLAFSNYLCNKLRQKTAYLELNGSNAILGLQKTYGICCFPEATLRDLPEILQKDFRFFVFDLGILNPNTYAEFFRSDIRIVIGSIRPWKLAPYRAFLEKILNYNISRKNLCCLSSLGMTSKTFSLKKGTRITVQPYPFLANPFQLHSSEWIFFERILKGI